MDAGSSPVPSRCPAIRTLYPRQLRLRRRSATQSPIPTPKCASALNRSLAPCIHRLPCSTPCEWVDKLEGRSTGCASGASLRVSTSASPGLQAAFADLGLAGDPSGTEHDYLAVFSQNTNISKGRLLAAADRPSRRSTLRPDGSASGADEALRQQRLAPLGVSTPLQKPARQLHTHASGTGCRSRRSSPMGATLIDSTSPRRQGRAVHPPASTSVARSGQAHHHLPSEHHEDLRGLRLRRTGRGDRRRRRRPDLPTRL